MSQKVEKRRENTHALLIYKVSEIAFFSFALKWPFFGRILESSIGDRGVENTTKQGHGDIYFLILHWDGLDCACRKDKCGLGQDTTEDALLLLPPPSRR